MGFRVEGYEGERDPRSATLSRSRGRAGGEMEEMQKLFEELMGGEEGFGEMEGLEDFDWEELWDDFMAGEEGYGEGGGVPQQGANRPTMFGAPIRPGGYHRGSSFGY